MDSKTKTRQRAVLNALLQKPSPQNLEAPQGNASPKRQEPSPLKPKAPHGNASQKRQEASPLQREARQGNASPKRQEPSPLKRKAPHGNASQKRQEASPLQREARQGNASSKRQAPSPLKRKHPQGNALPKRRELSPLKHKSPQGNASPKRRELSPLKRDSRQRKASPKRQQLGPLRREAPQGTASPQRQQLGPLKRAAPQGTASPQRQQLGPLKRAAPQGNASPKASDFPDAPAPAPALSPASAPGRAVPDDKPCNGKVKAQSSSSSDMPEEDEEHGDPVSMETCAPPLSMNYWADTEYVKGCRIEEKSSGQGEGGGVMRHAPPGLGAAGKWAREAASLKRKMGARGANGHPSPPPKRAATGTSVPATNKELAIVIRDVMGARPKYGDESARPEFWPADVPWLKGKSISQMNNVTLRKLAGAVLTHQARARERARASGSVVPDGVLGCAQRTKKQLSGLIRSKLGLRLQYGERRKRPSFWPEDVPWAKERPLSMMNHSELSSVFAAMVGAGVCPAGACLDQESMISDGDGGSDAGSGNSSQGVAPPESSVSDARKRDSSSIDAGGGDIDNDGDDEDDENDDDDDDETTAEDHSGTGSFGDRDFGGGGGGGGGGGAGRGWGVGGGGDKGGGAGGHGGFYRNGNGKSKKSGGRYGASEQDGYHGVRGANRPAGEPAAATAQDAEHGPPLPPSPPSLPYHDMSFDDSTDKLPAGGESQQQPLLPLQYAELVCPSEPPAFPDPYQIPIPSITIPDATLDEIIASVVGGESINGGCGSALNAGMFMAGVGGPGGALLPNFPSLGCLSGLSLSAMGGDDLGTFAGASPAGFADAAAAAAAMSCRAGDGPGGMSASPFPAAPVGSAGMYSGGAPFSHHGYGNFGMFGAGCGGGGGAGAGAGSALGVDCVGDFMGIDGWMVGEAV